LIFAQPSGGGVPQIGFGSDTLEVTVDFFTSPGFRVEIRFLTFFVFAATLLAQDASQSTSLSPPSVQEKWNHFANETFAPFTLAAGGFNAAVSQVTRSAPLYGRHWNAYPKRFGASVGDILTQNFFGDFLLASAFHEDTRYVRRGRSHRLWPRIGYAVSRAVIVRRDEGGETFNFANVFGTAMSAGLSNAYYPAVSRTPRETMTNWGTSIAGSGLVNLMPELWPDFSAWMMRHRPFRHP
jgi:hypothetical protein